MARVAHHKASTFRFDIRMQAEMEESRLPSLAIGNGRMLATLDSAASILSVCWPCVDSPNQMGEIVVKPFDAVYEPEEESAATARFGYEHETNIVFGRTAEGLSLIDMIIDLGDVSCRSDIHIRRVEGPHPELTVYVAPELDGRPRAQTIYWDETSQALLAYSRDKWLGVGSQENNILDFHCGRRSEDSSGKRFFQQKQLPRERIALRSVDGTLRVREATESTQIFFIYGHTREAVLESLCAVRKLSQGSLEQNAIDRANNTVSKLGIRAWSPAIDRILKRSCLVLDLLTNRDTGGTIAGPDVQSGIQSAPGYAAVWGRDAAWTMLGALAMGCQDQARKMIQFALTTQTAEGLWLHRHHTDGTMASSWGLHQIDETGIYLHAFACFYSECGGSEFPEECWNVVLKAANFLLGIIDDATALPLDTVDLWEERDGLHLYTVASVIAGLRAASYLALKLAPSQSSLAAQWSKAALEVQDATLKHFWKDDLGRFITSTHSSAALPMLDDARPDLTAVVQDGSSAPKTSIPQYPNWRDSKTLHVNYRHDISVLSLAVPFGILPLHDERVIRTAEQLRQNLWNEQTGGLRRYEGDTYGGGNPWPLATLWLAIYEGARGETEEARRLIEWVVAHTTEADLVPEQVHRSTGAPVAAVPLSWSHGMIALAAAAVLDRNVWSRTKWDLSASGFGKHDAAQ